MAVLNPASLTLLREAMKIVPEFDGRRESLGWYLAGVEEARALAGEELEGQLLKLVKVKLPPTIWNKIAKITFASIKEYLDYLHEIYDPPRDVYQLIAELGNTYQKSNESVDDYVDRIRYYAEKILQAYAADAPMTNEERGKIDNMARTIMTRGLLPEIESRMKVEGSLSDAVIKAKAIERQLADVKRVRESSEVKPRLSERGERKANINFVEPEKSSNGGKQLNGGASSLVSCQLCEKAGHTADKCKAGQGIAVSRPITVCQLCRKVGHTAIDCALAASLKQPATPAIVCQICTKPGHTADKCFSRSGMANSQGITICQKCGKRGHLAEKCFQNPCCHCGRSGHNPDTCYQTQRHTNRQAIGDNKGPLKSQQLATQSYRCQGWGHISRNCPAPSVNQVDQGNMGRNCSSNPNNAVLNSTGSISYAQATQIPSPQAVCRYCKNPGHLLEQCEIRARNNMRFTRQGNGNGQPGMGTQAEAFTGVHPTLTINTTNESSQG